MADKIKVKADYKEVKLYFIKPDRKIAFLDFYHSNIIPWLQGQGVTLADVWVVDRSDCLALVVALDRDGTDWYLIPHIGDYVDGPVPTPIMARTGLAIP
jgi:hypothetical protein